MSFHQLNKKLVDAFKYKREVTSVCPECIRIIPGLIEEDEMGIIRLRKRCPDHGNFSDIISLHADYYKWSQTFLAPGTPIDRDKLCTTNTGEICPLDCGTCARHKTSPILSLIDITNKCNLQCPICFANAAVTGNVIEPTYEEIIQILKHLRSLRPNPSLAVAFTGGEPTLRADLPELIREAYHLGFLQLVLITNGLKFKDLDYCRELMETGLQTIYLQFDGTTPEPWLKTRGVNLWPLKQRIIQNFRKVGFDSVVLVPTIVRGVNDHEIGNIIQFAIDNIDIIRCVNFQPVSLCGRIPPDQLAEMRINVSDLIHLISDQTNGLIHKKVWYPIPVMAPFANLICWYKDLPGADFACHPDCGMASFFFKNETNGALENIGDYLDIPKFYQLTKKYWNLVKDKEFNQFKSIADTITELLPFQSPLLDTLSKNLDHASIQVYRHYIMGRFLLDALTTVRKTGKILNMAARVLLRTHWNDLANFMYNTLMIGCMHFQDLYSLRTERTERCVIHYGVYDRRDGKVKQFPFCTYNAIHRPIIEAALAVPLSQVQEGETVKVPSLNETPL